MLVKPSDTVSVQFTTQNPTTGAAANADSLPTGVLVRNGDDTAESVSVSNIATGVYKASVTLPADYAAGDEVQLRISATVAAVAGKAVIWSAEVDTARESETYARIGSNGAGLTALGDTRLANLDAAVSSRSTLAAGAQMDLVNAPNATALTAMAAGVWAYGTRTLTGFGTLVADIWAYATRTLTQGAASVLAAVQGTGLTQYRGATWTIAITGLGALTGYAKIYFALKDEKGDTDADAMLLIEKTAGLTRLNGAAYATAADGSITIDSEGSGNLTITVKPAATAQLEARGGLHYGIKLVKSDGTVSQLSDGAGKFAIASDNPRAIS